MEMMLGGEETNPSSPTISLRRITLIQVKCLAVPEAHHERVRLRRLYPQLVSVSASHAKWEGDAQLQVPVQR